VTGGRGASHLPVLLDHGANLVVRPRQSRGVYVAAHEALGRPHRLLSHAGRSGADNTARGTLKHNQRG